MADVVKIKMLRDQIASGWALYQMKLIKLGRRSPHVIRLARKIEDAKINVYDLERGTKTLGKSVRAAKKILAIQYKKCDLLYDVWKKDESLENLTNFVKAEALWRRMLGVKPKSGKFSTGAHKPQSL